MHFGLAARLLVPGLDQPPQLLGRKALVGSVGSDGFQVAKETGCAAMAGGLVEGDGFQELEMGGGQQIGQPDGIGQRVGGIGQADLLADLPPFGKALAGGEGEGE